MRYLKPALFNNCRSVAHYRFPEGVILETTSNPFFASCMYTLQIEASENQKRYPRNHKMFALMNKAIIHKSTILGILFNSGKLVSTCVNLKLTNRWYEMLILRDHLHIALPVGCDVWSSPFQIGPFKFLMSIFKIFNAFSTDRNCGWVDSLYATSRRYTRRKNVTSLMRYPNVGDKIWIKISIRKNCFHNISTLAGKLLINNPSTSMMYRIL